MRRPRGHRAALFVLYVSSLGLGPMGCAEILGVNEGKPRPAGAGGQSGGGGDPGEGGAGAGGSGAGGSGAGGSGAGAEGGGGAAPAPPTAPRVLFTDLESGPAGAYVTLYGARLVEDGGDEPEVTFDGVPVAPVLARDGASNDDVARALDVIVVRVSPDAPVGAADIVVRRGGVASEPARFTVRSGTIRYVDAVGGDDQSPDCAEAAPCASLGKLASVLAPGDVAYVREGDYPGDFTCGADFANQAITCALPLTELADPGTASRPIAVVGYPGERPRVGLLGAPAGAELSHVAFRVADAGHVILANLELTDAGLGGLVRDMESLRVVGCRFDTLQAGGIYMKDNADALTVLGSTFADISTFGVHACDPTRVVAEVGFSEFDAMSSPLWLDPTKALDVLFHGNRVRATALLDLQTAACAPSNDNPIGRVAVFNNVLHDAAYALILPKESTSGAEVLFFNNTLHDLDCAFRREDPATSPIPGGEAIHVRNNIIVPDGGSYFCFHNGGVVTPADDVGLVGSHNVFWNGVGSVPEALGARVDPLLVDSDDLALAAGSPAANAGTEALGGSVQALPSFVRTDHDGLPRVLGDGIDIGAHERVPE
ncbi:right-handed parallel beta-helix repeat-containing protein [Sorangium sp. So ce367]|uniref:choice-of-anchor Q domain-containing protein n=1 Tax=Sorangium sp. So ce367 TaxID=3133305 RepID=UPI003F5EAD15